MALPPVPSAMRYRRSICSVVDLPPPVKAGIFSPAPVPLAASMLPSATRRNKGYRSCVGVIPGVGSKGLPFRKLLVPSSESYAIEDGREPARARPIVSSRSSNREAHVSKHDTRNSSQNCSVAAYSVFAFSDTPLLFRRIPPGPSKMSRKHWELRVRNTSCKRTNSYRIGIRQVARVSYSKMDRRHCRRYAQLSCPCLSPSQAYKCHSAAFFGTSHAFLCSNTIVTHNHSISGFDSKG